MKPQTQIRAIPQGRVRAVPPRRNGELDIRYLRFGGQMYVLNVLAEDALTELKADPAAQPARMWIRSAFTALNKPRRRYKRELSEQDYLTLEIAIGDSADTVEQHVRRARAFVREAMVQKVKYEKLTAAELTGFVGGLLVCMAEVHKTIYGRNSSDLDEAHWCLLNAERKMEISLLNENSEIDFKPAHQAIVDMFVAVGDAVEKVFLPQAEEVAS